MKIALAQIRCEPGNTVLNRRAFGTCARQAAAAGCRAVFFPEMSDTGYTMAAVRNGAEPWPGPSYDAASAAAAENGIILVCGISERTGKGIYNSAAFFGPDGSLLGRYRKTHLFTPAGEHTVCLPGGSPRVIAAHDSVWGLSICFDLRFPELYRHLVRQGATVLVNCAAWPAVRARHWEQLACARAIENQAFFIGVNRAGTDGDMRMAGTSMVIAPDGTVIARAGSGEELLTADIDLAAVAAVRDALPVLQAARPDIFTTSG